MKNIKWYTLFSLILILAALLGSCSKKAENTNVEPLTASNVTDKTVWERITAESDYTSYSFWPNHEGMSPGQAPHGPFHKVYINNTLAAALPIKGGIVPEGSIIVKENYSKAKEFTGTTVMVKVKNYAPEINDWFWAKYSPQGETQASGQPKGCISCHEGMKKNDYIIIHPLDM